MLRSLKSFLMRRTGPVYKLFLMPVRASTAIKHASPPLLRVFPWLLRSREDTNFTYDLTETNLRYLAHAVAIATGRAVADCRRYIDEGANDEPLQAHIRELTHRSPFRWSSDDRPRFARRLGWYAIARATRPRLIVETGVDKGLGSVLLCSALMKNAQEGFPGHYRGTDINPKAGWLLSGRYAEFGKILYGDSLGSLAQLDEPIDLFINDSDHSAEYEAREYEVIASKLSERGLVIGDNAHVSDALCTFSERSARPFLYLQEQPLNHWYRGAGIGISFPASAVVPA